MNIEQEIRERIEELEKKRETCISDVMYYEHGAEVNALQWVLSLYDKEKDEFIDDMLERIDKLEKPTDR